jgi:predicted AAA+ superfamily ATPase
MATHGIFLDRIDPLQLRNAGRQLHEALTFGQFPEILGLWDEEERRQLLRRYRDSYFLRDLMQLANLENVDGLRSILLHLCRWRGFR